MCISTALPLQNRTSIDKTLGLSPAHSRPLRFGLSAFPPCQIGTPQAGLLLAGAFIEGCDLNSKSLSSNLLRLDYGVWHAACLKRPAIGPQLPGVRLCASRKQAAPAIRRIASRAACGLERSLAVKRR